MEISWSIFLGGLGVGSVVTSVVQHILARSAQKADSLVNEKKEAFVGYLAALAKLKENDRSGENLANYGLWVARIQIIASPSVAEAIEHMGQTAPAGPQRQQAFDHVLMEMRKDLSIR